MFFYGEGVNFPYTSIYDDYVIEGWYLDEDFETKAEIPFFMPAENLMLYAKTEDKNLYIERQSALLLNEESVFLIIDIYHESFPNPIETHTYRKNDGEVSMSHNYFNGLSYDYESVYLSEVYNGTYHAKSYFPGCQKKEAYDASYLENDYYHQKAMVIASLFSDMTKFDQDGNIYILKDQYMLELTKAYHGNNQDTVLLENVTLELEIDLFMKTHIKVSFTDLKYHYDVLYDFRSIGSTQTFFDEPNICMMDDRQGVTDDKIKLGMLLYDNYPSKQVKEFITNYIEFINSEGGIHGRSIELISYEFLYGQNDLVTYTRKLMLEDQVFAIIMSDLMFANSEVTELLSLYEDFPILGIENVLNYPPNMELSDQVFFTNPSYKDDGLMALLRALTSDIYKDEDNEPLSENDRIAIIHSGFSSITATADFQNFIYEYDITPKFEMFRFTSITNLAIDEIMREVEDFNPASIVLYLYSFEIPKVLLWMEQHDFHVPVFLTTIGTELSSTLLDQLSMPIYMNEDISIYNLDGTYTTSYLSYQNLMSSMGYTPVTRPSLDLYQTLHAIFYDLLFEVGDDLSHETLWTYLHTETIDLYFGGELKLSKPYRRSNFDISYLLTTYENGKWIIVDDYRFIDDLAIELNS